MAFANDKGTTLTYNTVKLYNCTTESWDTKAIYDSSGTDLMYHEHKIAVIGYIYAKREHDGAFDEAYHNHAQDNLADTIIGIRQKLLDPRSNFEFKCGDQILLKTDVHQEKEHYPEKQGRDLDNGPKPESLDIVSFQGTCVLKVRYRITVAHLDCATQADDIQGVLSNRWSMSDEIDEHGYTTRMIKGRLRVTHARLNVHDFDYRTMCLPPVEKTFKRKRIAVIRSVDGLTLDYEIVDQELKYAIPLPAMSWTAVHSLMGVNDASQVLGAITIEMTGDRNTKKSELLIAAFKVAESRLGNIARNANRDPSGGSEDSFEAKAQFLIKEWNVTDFMHENKVQISIKASFPKNEHYLRTVNEVFGSHIGEVPAPGIPFTSSERYGKKLYNVDVTELQIGPHGTASAAGLLVGYLQDPCNPDHRMYPELDLSDTGDTDGDTPSSGGGTGTVTKGEHGKAPINGEVSKDPPRITVKEGKLPQEVHLIKPAADHLKDQYLNYDIEVTYEQDQMNFWMPISAFSESGETQLAAKFAEAGFKLASSYATSLTEPRVRRVVVVNATRHNQPPVLPEPVKVYTDGNDIDCHLLDYTISPSAPVPTATGDGLLYNSQATYVYGLNQAPDSKQNLYEIGAVPWTQMELGKGGTAFKASTFQKTKIAMGDNKATATPDDSSDSSSSEDDTP